MAGRSRRAGFAAGLAALLCALGSAAGPAGGQARELAVRAIGSFDAPVQVAHAPGARRLLFVVEQPGRIRVLRRGRELRRPFLELGDRVLAGGEQGLLSVAFDPGYQRNRRLYVYYVDRDGDIRIDMLRRRPHAQRVDPQTRRRVIVVPHPTNSNHNGGQLVFGPDGRLYAATGDGGSAGDPPNNAQNPEVLLGKLLRIEPRRRGGYRAPQSNPFADGPGRNEIYATGLRNPYRFSFDSADGTLWIADVGQNSWEEINRVQPRAARGANFGWKLFEGTHPFTADASPPPGYQPPVHEYSSQSENCAVTGGFVSRDPELPALAGRYVYADFCGGELRSLDAGATAPGSTDAATGLAVDLPSGFGEGPRRELYVTSLQGPVYRIVER